MNSPVIRNSGAGSPLVSCDTRTKAAEFVGEFEKTGRIASATQQSPDDYGVAINPVAVATIHRLPQRTMESIRPTPGTVSPRAAIQTPSGPSSTAVPPRTSRTVQPSMVAGFVSGTATIASRWVTASAGRVLLAGSTAELEDTAPR